MRNVVTSKGQVVQDPPIAKFLFNDTRMAWFWLVVRIWLGYQWVSAALGKIDNPAWVETGAALRGFWTNAIQIPESGRPAIAFDWYRSFISFLLEAEAYVWFGKLVVYGEFIVGVALILGAFTGIAALFGAFMNWNFMMAGAASTNPVLLILAIGLVMAWKISGYIGLDHFLLPALGTPWNRPESEDKEESTTDKRGTEAAPA
ncbi:MAG: DoxX family membrane protein [Candidatus Promineifilaceae bacterium]|nr:DoxX family membrane protein [Candidatus Promineifilaceae bacterium]